VDVENARTIGRVTADKNSHDTKTTRDFLWVIIFFKVAACRCGKEQIYMYNLPTSKVAKYAVCADKRDRCDVVIICDGSWFLLKGSTFVLVTNSVTKTNIPEMEPTTYNNIIYFMLYADDRVG